jgi:hypothetical protein
VDSCVVIVSVPEALTILLTVDELIDLAFSQWLTVLAVGAALLAIFPGDRVAKESSDRVRLGGLSK